LLAAFQLIHKLVNGRQLIWGQAKVYSDLPLILGIEFEVGFKTPPFFFQLTHLTLKAVVHGSQLRNHAVLQLNASLHLAMLFQVCHVQSWIISCGHAGLKTKSAQYLLIVGCH